LDTQSVITRTATVAEGRFAPGHLGELTQQVPFEMVDEVLTSTGRVQARVRDLPSRVVVYLLLAAGLFAELGYRQVWARLIAGLEGLPVARPGSSAFGAGAPAQPRCGRCLRWWPARPPGLPDGGGCWCARSTARPCSCRTAR